MKVSNITSIRIEGRGKNRDIYGNPYSAWKAVIDVKMNHHNVRMVLYEPMTWGDSYESRVLRNAIEGINETLNINLKENDKRINYTYKHVSRDADLEKPQNWK